VGGGGTAVQDVARIQPEEGQTRWHRIAGDALPSPVNWMHSADIFGPQRGRKFLYVPRRAGWSGEVSEKAVTRAKNGRKETFQ